MSTSTRKLSIQRPASAMAKSHGTSGLEYGRPPPSPTTAQLQGLRSSKTMSNKSERRRSMPAPSSSHPPTANDAHELARLPDELAHLAINTTLYERRRSNGVMSPLVATSSANSTHSDRGGYGRSREREREQSIASAEETLSLHRLRSNSGLSLHTNSAVLRRYTDYNADGSTRLSPTDERFDSDGRYGEELYDSRNGSPGVSGTPTTPKLLSWEMVSAILDDPVARQRLMEYTRSYGGTENLDFLEKVEQYNKALHSVTALMANISTTFTCMTATEPLNLPPQLSRSLNADVKHVSTSILPGLEMLFGDVNTHIKERVLRNIYPSFAKRQLAFRMKTSLGAASAGAAHTPFRFAGLGQAFCLTDPYRPDNPVVYASDAFAHVLGYSRSEDIPRTGRFFRGPELNNGDSFVEDLVLTRNHRDSRPFWSLVSGCPLKTASGRVRFVLSGLVDVTDAVKSQADIVRAMSAEIPTAAMPSPSMGFSSLNREIELPTAYAPSTRSKVSKSDKTSASASSRSFFNPFSRKRRTDTNVDTPPSRGEAVSGFNFMTDLLPRATQAALVPHSPQTIISPSTAPSPSLDDKMSIYSRFMVLQFVPGSSHGQDYLGTMPPPISRRNSRYGAYTSPTAPVSAVSRLKVAFSSLPMLDLLGLGPAAQEAVMYHDVFAVLSELAGSPSITPVFRANVRQRIITSESASLELSIPASGMPAPGAFSAGLGAGLASPTSHQTGSDGSGASTTSRRSSLLLSGRSKRDSAGEEGVGASWDYTKAPPESRWPGSSNGQRRRSGTYDHPDTSERRGRPARMQRLMSHWTPLKDVDGTAAWVILVISPVVEQ
ncbi:hypothetical protein SCUCBS95973_001158 [Sporothrix curviconia]|uniref:PAS domain-containing protein n=1 Tax=Sporothrix curviconia TaxID=1260050 RepID=A0ABP0AWH1_9PEZI